MNPFAEAADHAETIAIRLRDVGLSSSTLSALRDALKVGQPNVAELQNLANELEADLRAAGKLHLGDYNLPALRLILSEAYA